MDATDAERLRHILSPGPVALRYGRISNPIEGSLSRQKQDNATKAYWQAMLADRGIADGGFWFDEKVSGYSVPFLEREDARELFDYSRPGDHVIVQYLSRGWRNTRDALKCIDMFGAKGVTVHIMELSLDTGSEIGRMILTVMAAVMEFEVSQIAKRTREDKAARINAGRPVGASAPVGWKIAEVEGQRYFQPDEDDRKLAGWCREQKAQGATAKEIALKLEGAKGKRAGYGFTEATVKRYILAAKKGFPSAKESWNSPESVARREKLATQKRSRLR